MVQLTKPDLFNKRPLLGAKPARTAKLLLKHGAEVEKNSGLDAPIAILIRTKNDEKGLKELCKYIELARQSYKGRIDLVVVATESSDRTTDIAKQFGATLVAISQHEFNYPKGINLGLDAVNKDVVATFITVGHAIPVLSNSLRAGARHFADRKIVGVYGQILPNDNASFWESRFFWNDQKLRGSHQLIPTANPGVMGATNCMVRMAAWREQPFDEAYAMGGEDTAWARWALRKGYKIIFEPALTVHHTHGLGPINLIRQNIHWRQVSRQSLAFDQRAIRRRRPDLF